MHPEKGGEGQKFALKVFFSEGCIRSAALRLGVLKQAGWAAGRQLDVIEYSEPGTPANPSTAFIFILESGSFRPQLSQLSQLRTDDFDRSEGKQILHKIRVYFQQFRCVSIDCVRFKAKFYFKKKGFNEITN